jgi:hypothetical protein
MAASQAAVRAARAPARARVSAAISATLVTDASKPGIRISQGDNPMRSAHALAVA